jgi:ligand-binding sensor domain-containing protein/signal transduction histidine kinase
VQRLRISVIILFLLFLAWPSAHGQYYNLTFRNYSSATGLSQSEVECTFQDKDGFLWIGTRYGLTRYDGKEFKTYFHHIDDPNSIGENFILDISQDKSGFLWMVILNTGISRLNPLNNKFENFSPQEGKNSIISEKVTSMLIDNTDNIWIGTQEGLSVYDPVKKLFSNLSMVPGESKTLSISCMEKDDKGNIWIGADDLLYFSSGDPSRLKRIRTSRSIGTINSFQFDSTGKGWIASDSGLYYFLNNGLDSIVLVRPDFFPQKEEVEDVEYDAKGNLWVATKKNGLIIYFPSTGFVDRLREDFSSSRGLMSNRLFDLYHDYRGGMWISGENGLQSFHDAAQRFNIYSGLSNISNRLRGSTIYGIYEKNEMIILATSGGIIAYNRVKSSFYPVVSNHELKNTTLRFRYIHEEEKDKWWVSSDYGLFELVKKNKEFILSRPKALPESFYSLSVRLYIKDGNTIWLATTDSGLIRYNTRTKKMVHFRNDPKDPNSLTEDRINIIAFDRQGNLLVGHDYGLSILKKDSLKFENYPYQNGKPNTISDRYVYDVFDDGRLIWMATYGGGINILDKETKNITYLTTKDGLCNDAIYTITPQNDSILWLGTNKGLSKLNTKTRIFINYEMDDGIPSNEFNMLSKYRDSIGEIFMGTINGVISFKPENISENNLQPKVYLSRIRKNGVYLDDSLTAVINRDRVITTKYREDVFMEFSPLTFYGNSRTNLQYKIREKGDQWTEGESGSILPMVKTEPGNYTIDIRLLNEAGIGSSPVWTLTFIVQPPYWMTLGFRLTASAILLLIGLTAVRGYTRIRLERQKSQFLRQQAVEQERSRISAELHDDIGGGLTAIRLLSEMNLEKNTDASSRKYLEKISASSNELIQKMNEIVWALNINNDNLQSLVSYTRQYAVSYLDDLGIQCKVETTENIPDITVTGNNRRSVFLLVKETLNNIAKHSEASSVEIKFEVNSKLLIHVHDNGKGFSTNFQNVHGNGLVNMQRRIQKLRGEMKIINSKGTRVDFDIPIKNLNS